MEPEKKKRTILMDEDPSKVAKPSLASRINSFPRYVRRIIRPNTGGVGGTLLKFDRNNAPKASIKWKAGFIKSEAKSATGKRQGKPKRGIQIEFKF